MKILARTNLVLRVIMYHIKMDRNGKIRQILVSNMARSMRITSSNMNMLQNMLLYVRNNISELSRADFIEKIGHFYIILLIKSIFLNLISTLGIQ